MPRDQHLKESRRIARHKRRRHQNGPLSLKCQKASRDRLAALNDPLLFFGKHNGKRLSEVPTSYLVWLTKNITEPGSLRMEGLMVAIRRFLDTGGNRPAERFNGRRTVARDRKSRKSRKRASSGKPDGSLGYRQVGSGKTPDPAQHPGTMPGEDGAAE